MPTPDSYLEQVWCTDEHIAIRAHGDFQALLPKSQILAAGADGVIAAGNLWQVTSATTDFQGQGVTLGHVVQLISPRPNFPGSGRLFAVSAVSGAAVTLRAIGQGDGVGQPPVSAAGLSGIGFVVGTFSPQIEDASYRLNQRFGIHPEFPRAAPSHIADARVLRQAAVCTVLYRAYLIETRTQTGDFAFKLAEMRQEMTEAMEQCVIRWGGSASAESQPPTTYFNTRLSR